MPRKQPLKAPGHPAADGVAKLVHPKVPDLVERMFDLAEGLKVLDEDGQSVFTRPPDRLAIEYLLNRAFGKPALSVPASGVGIQSKVVIVLPENGRDIA